MANDEQAMHINDLPDDLLLAILQQHWKTMYKYQQYSLRLVCRRWDTVLIRPLWSSLVVDLRGCLTRTDALARRLEAKHQLLVRFAPDIDAFKWEGPSCIEPQHAALASRLPALLALLQPSQLVSLKLRSYNSSRAQLAELAPGWTRFARLTCLHLHSFDKHATSEQSSAVMDSILQLSHLRELDLACDNLELGRLTQLRQLGRLVLWGPRPLEPTCFPGGLKEFHVYMHFFDMLQIAGCEMTVCSLSCGMAHLSECSPTLTLRHVYQLPSLPRLLSALLPNPSRAFALSLHHGSLDAAALTGCTQLRQLRSLKLHGLQLNGCSLEEAVAALVQHSTCLSALQLGCMTWGDGAFLSQVEPWLAALRGLTFLQLSGRLSSLPYGEYLTGLVHLDLSGNRLSRLPPAVATAARLTYLDVSDNPGLALLVEDIDILSVLGSLKQLAASHVGSIEAGFAKQMVQRLPQVRLWL